MHKRRVMRYAVRTNEDGARIIDHWSTRAEDHLMLERPRNSGGVDEAFCENVEVELLRGAEPGHALDFTVRGVEDAYRLLGWPRMLPNSELRKRAEELMQSEFEALQAKPKPSPYLAALLVALCSRKTAMIVGSQALSILFADDLIPYLYYAEAERYLQTVDLPLPATLSLATILPSPAKAFKAARALSEETRKKTLLMIEAARAETAEKQALEAEASAVQRQVATESDLQALLEQHSGLVRACADLRERVRQTERDKRVGERVLQERLADVRQYKKDASDRKDWVIERLSQKIDELREKLEEKSEECVRLRRRVDAEAP
ncbi:hypothetical protein JCM10213v2_007835 [Rhodosporidiobolus nylandii]